MSRCRLRLVSTAARSRGPEFLLSALVLGSFIVIQGCKRDAPPTQEETSPRSASAASDGSADATADLALADGAGTTLSAIVKCDECTPGDSSTKCTRCRSSTYCVRSLIDPDWLVLMNTTPRIYRRHVEGWRFLGFASFDFETGLNVPEELPGDLRKIVSPLEGDCPWSEERPWAAVGKFFSDLRGNTQPTLAREALKSTPERVLFAVRLAGRDGFVLVARDHCEQWSVQAFGFGGCPQLAGPAPSNAESSGE